MEIFIFISIRYEEISDINRLSEPVRFIYLCYSGKKVSVTGQEIEFLEKRQKIIDLMEYYIH